MTVHSVSSVDSAMLVSLLADTDVEFMRKIIHTFRVHGDRTLSRMQVAITAGDQDTVEQCAHSLKGASANLGLTTLEEESALLEHAAREGRAKVRDVDAVRRELQTAVEELLRFETRYLTLKAPDAGSSGH